MDGPYVADLRENAILPISGFQTHFIKFENRSVFNKFLRRWSLFHYIYCF